MAATASSQTDPLIFDSSFLARLEQIHLLARRLVQGLAQARRRSQRLGHNLEFADYRNYVPGDDLRSLDWNAFARLDRMFIKLFEEEEDLELHLLIDASASMRWRPEPLQRSALKPVGFTKFDSARRLAAALAYMAIAHLDRVRLHYFADGPVGDSRFFRGKGKFHGILEFLSHAPDFKIAANGTRLRGAVDRVCREAGRRSQVIILSDFFDPDGFLTPLKQLTHHRHEAAVVQILDPWELAPELSGDFRLIDSESESAMEITLDSKLLARYQDELSKHNESLKSACLARHIPCVQTTSEAPFEDLVLSMLRKGGLSA